MTPKEKARELFKKYSVYNLDNGEQYFVSNKFAKQCALIAVDEIIKYSPNKPIEEYNPIEYFKKVKQEIEKL